MLTATNISAVKCFLGLCGYFRDFIPWMSTRTKALRNPLKKSSQWTEETEKQFRDLMQAITGPAVMLFHPGASKLGCGAILAQEKNDMLRPVRFSSRAFSPAKSHWVNIHQKLFSVK